MMTVRLLMLAGATILCAAPAWADDLWYVSGSIGGYFREDDSASTHFFHADDPAFKVPGTVQRSYDPGVTGNLAVGYTVMPQVRVEAEICYTDYTQSTINPLTHNPNFARLDGSTFNRQRGDEYGRFTGTVNIFYDFTPISGFTPYLGLGIGASADHQSSGVLIGPTGSSFNQSGGTSTQGLALLEAGFAYPLTENLSVTASYRYLHFFEDAGDVAHIVKMGLRYAF